MIYSNTCVFKSRKMPQVYCPERFTGDILYSYEGQKCMIPHLTPKRFVITA